MLRRPFMYAASAMAAAIIISYYFGAVPALLPTVFAAPFFLYQKRPASCKSAAFLIMASYLLGICCLIFEDTRPSVLSMHGGETTEMICVVSKVEKRQHVDIEGEPSGYMQLRGRTITVSGCVAKEKVLINYYENDPCRIIPGDVIEITGLVDKPQGRKNPGCFDYALYLRSVGIKHVIGAEYISLCKSADSGSVVSLHARRWLGVIYDIKENFLLKLEDSAGSDTAALMRAVMFGEKNSIDEDLMEEFQKNGTAHILAVSGLHIGIIYAFLSAIWRRKKGRLFFVIIIAFFSIYMIMASFSPSVVRAVMMVWLHIFAVMTNRRYDMASAAFFTAMLMLIKQPMQIFNAGFQMSFLAVLTLSLLIPVIKSMYNGVFAAGIAVQLGLMPYTIYTFNYFSLAAVFVNVPVIFLVGIIVPLGLIFMLVTYICEPLGQMVSAVIYGSCRILTELNSLTGIDGITVFKVCSPDIKFLAIYYLILFVFVSEDGRLLFLRKKKKVISYMAIFIILVSIIFGSAAGNHFIRSEVVFVDVGQGDCIHLRTGKDRDYLVDGGGSITYNVGKKTLKPYLLKNRVKKIDGAFVTHLHTDHYKGIAELCREGMVDRLFVYEGYRVKEKEIMEDTGLQQNDITYLYAGQTVMLGKGAQIEVLWPDKSSIAEYERMTADEEDENALSLIMKITIREKTILVTGDVDSECLDGLAGRYGKALDTDILKAAHHGSRYSDSVSFANAAEPEYVVFQVGKNNFGHPDKGVIENFRQKGIIIYRNDKDGAIAFDFDENGQIKVRTVKENFS